MIDQLALSRYRLSNIKSVKATGSSKKVWYSKISRTSRNIKISCQFLGGILAFKVIWSGKLSIRTEKSRARVGQSVPRDLHLEEYLRLPYSAEGTAVLKENQSKAAKSKYVRKKMEMRVQWSVYPLKKVHEKKLATL